MNDLPVGASIPLTPDQIATAQPVDENQIAVGQSVQLSPDQRKSAGVFNPLEDFSSQQLVDLQKQNPDFNLVQEYSARPDLMERPGMNQKIADAHNLLRQEPFSVDLKKVPGQVWDIAKGFGKQAWNYAQGLVGAPVASLAHEVTGNEEASRQALIEGQRNVAENVAGTELAMHGLGQTVGAAKDFISRKLGIDKPLTEYTPAEKVADLFDALKNVKAQQEIVKGQGPILSTVGSEVVDELKKNGTPVRPDEVSELAAGDPFTWYLMGKGFHGATSLIPEGASRVVGAGAERVGQIAAQIGGKTVETAGDITRLGAQATGKIAPAVGAVVGAIKGAEHGPAGLVTGLGLGYKAGKFVAEGAENVATKANQLSSIGAQISSKAPMVSPIAQLGQDVLHSAPGAAVELGKGVAFDLGLAAVTSEESPEERANSGIGTLFGGLGAASRVAGRTLSGQIIAPRAYGVNRVTPSSGAYPALDTVHNSAIQNAAPGVVARMNAIRLFTKGIDPRTDVFLAGDSAGLQTALEQSGMSPGQAKTFAEQQGFFSASLPDKNGDPRRVIVVKNPDTAPHEAFHAIQDVLGEEANRKIDTIVKQEYGDKWENEGTRYALRLVGASGLKGSTWREAVLDASGWGRAEAADKIATQMENQLKSQLGAQASPVVIRSYANEEWARILSEAQKRNPDVPLSQLQLLAWRDVLSPEESQQVADRYLAREIAAENFDAVFKHTGPDLNQNPSVISKLAGVVANLVSALGGEPTTSRVSEGGAMPLSHEVGKAVVEATKGVQQAKPEIEPPAAPTRGIPTTPEAQQEAASEARDLAKSAPAEAPAPAEPNLPQPQSPREILGTVAEAIANRSGVKINYLSAPEEPAAATTSSRPLRRRMIELYRSMPQAARRLWEKTFFPERVLRVKDGKFQVLGWAPEVFAANAHKIAQAIADITAKGGSFHSPYELDLNNRTFTAKGWQDLYEDVQSFVKNQIAGRTGAGEKLVVPPHVTEQGFHAPSVTRGAEALQQEKADFINMLFNFRLPDTARITGGKLPLNIAGQEISAATKPGRISIPVEPKPKFTGDAAKNLGIEGRSILEVNPARQALSRAAKDAGVELPSMIEAVQRLNLENISEVQHAPEASPEFRGNTLTLTAGFQPGKEDEGKPGLIGRVNRDGQVEARNVKNLARMRHEEFGWDPSDGANWRYRPDTKTLYWWGEPDTNETRENVEGWLGAKGYEVKQSRRITAASGSESYFEAHGMEGQFSPPQAMDDLRKMSAEDWHNMSKIGQPGYFSSEKFGGGITGWAKEVGSQAKTAEDLGALRQANQLFKDMGREAMANKDLDTASTLFTKAQAAREAFEFATGKKIDDPSAKLVSNTIAQLKPRDFTPEEIDKIPGAKISYPARTYLDASRKAFEDKGNPYIRRSATPEADANPDNSNRDLLVQITSDLMNPPGNFNMDTSRGYYDKLYSGKREGYTRMDDFWEIPQWMGFASHIYPNADVYVVRDMEQAKQFLNTAKYRKVFFSALDVNKPFIHELAKSYDGKVGVGGWVDPKYFADLPNVIWHNDLQASADSDGMQFKDGVDYRHFEGSGAIPRLNMSTGCKFQCAFCTVEKAVKEMPDDLIKQQAEEIAKLGTELVYLGDKTFGQAKNYKKLADLNDQIKAINPKFKGFVVQTTASTMPKFDPEWLAKSGIRFVELGIETYNDPILRSMHKPATEALMDKSVEALRKNKITLIPNIIIGLPGETPETYSNTLDFLKKNADVISHANIYNLAIYPDAKLAKEITTASPDDFNENILEKTFHTNPEVHRQFAGDVYGLASEMLDKTPGTMEGQLQPEPQHIRDAEELWPEIAPQQDQKKDIAPQQDRKKGVLPQQDYNKKELASEAQNEENGGVTEAQFKPKKKTAKPEEVAENWKLKPATSGFSKAWIMPNGIPVQLGGQWHHDWMNENPDVRKQYGLPEDEGGEEIRAKALQKGFARINYDARTGGLTVEAREKDWPNIAPAVSKFIESNLGQVDKVQAYLFNARVDKIADSGYGTLFDKSGKEAKMAAVPFLGAPPEVTELSPQATEGALSEQGAPGTLPVRGKRATGQFQAPELEEEVRKIREGLSSGQTFTPAGAIWQPKERKTDVVSLASVNIPRDEFTPEKFFEALQPYEKVLKEPNLVAGAYTFSKDGKPVVSIDVNALVPKKFRANTLKFAKANDQKAIWDVEKNEEVSAGGEGETKLTDPEHLAQAAASLRKGEEYKFPKPGEVAQNRKDFSLMSGEELSKEFPEAVVSPGKSKTIPSEIKKSPLYLQANDEGEAVDKFAKKMVDFANEYKDDPIFKRGSRWYEDFTPMLKKEFGNDAPIFAELLAATSPQTDPEQNFSYAVEALDLYKKGAFDKTVKKFEEGLEMLKTDAWEKWLRRHDKSIEPTPARFMAEWIDKFNLRPKRNNGKLFGFHSVRVLQVLARKWLELNAGPKTRNFVSNLIGSTHEATIDLWADRTMRRLGYEGYKDKWRILPQNSAPVSDEDFAFAQKVFSKAADKLGMKPSALQGALWFAEKKLWGEKGWGRLDFGNFQKEVSKLRMIRGRHEHEARLTKLDKQVKVPEVQELFK